MDAQKSRTGSRQYCLQRQWEPTHKQPHSNATGDRTAVARQPWAWNSVNQIAGEFAHNCFSGQQRGQIKRTVGEFTAKRLNCSGL